MRNVLSKKLNNKKGFTLAELLIVVAIIAVLVAIMIPVFGSARENAILAKDVANIRAGYAEAIIDAMAESSYSGGTITITELKVDVETGTSITNTSNVTGQIEVTRAGATNGPIKISLDSDVTITTITLT